MVYFITIKYIKMDSKSIDKLTMELMMNKAHYKKYLAKTNPEKFIETQEHINKIVKYKHRISNLMNELLEDSCKSNISAKYTNDINDSFDQFMRTCMKYFELKELEQNSGGGGKKDEEDDEILFGEMSDEPVAETTSIWGKAIKKTHNPKYTMDMYVQSITTKSVNDQANHGDSDVDAGPDAGADAGADAGPDDMI